MSTQFYSMITTLQNDKFTCNNSCEKTRNEIIEFMNNKEL